MTLAMPLFHKFKGIMFGLTLETCLSNLKSVALTILELLAFNLIDQFTPCIQTDRHTIR